MVFLYGQSQMDIVHLYLKYVFQEKPKLQHYLTFLKIKYTSPTGFADDFRKGESDIEGPCHKIKENWLGRINDFIKRKENMWPNCYRAKLQGQKKCEPCKIQFSKAKLGASYAGFDILLQSLHKLDDFGFFTRLLHCLLKCSDLKMLWEYNGPLLRNGNYIQ